MTRAWPAAALTVAVGCAPIPAATPWVVHPESPTACTAATIANGGCFDAPLLAPPIVVGPGRVQVATRAGLSPPAGYNPIVPVRNQFRFFVEEIGRAGHAPVADGVCPGRRGTSELARLVRLPSGETGVLCLEYGNMEGCVPTSSPGCFDGPGGCVQTHCEVTFAHFGVVDRAQHAVVWRGRSVHSAGMSQDSVRVAAFGDQIAVIYKLRFDPASPANPWIVSLAPKAVGFEASDEMEEEWLAAVLVVDRKLTLVFGRNGYERQYRQLTIGADGTRTSRRLEQAGPVAEGTLDDACLAEGADGSVTVSLPYRLEGDTSLHQSSRLLTLRYHNAFVPEGPDVYPSARALCRPRIAGGGAHRVRATFDDHGALIVYQIGDEEDRPGSLHVLRSAR